MQTCIHPKGDVYTLDLKSSAPIRLASGTRSFDVIVSVKNVSSDIWDTSDRLRLVARLIEPGEKLKEHPWYVSHKSIDFPVNHVHPKEEVVFDVNLCVNLVPPGEYVLLFDLVVEMKYFLSATGARRVEFPVHILDRSSEASTDLPMVVGPPAPPRRTWPLDPNQHQCKQAFRIHKIGQQRGGKGKTVVIVNWGYLFFRHYVHFLEFIVCLHAIICEYIGDTDHLLILIGEQEFSNGNNPDVQRFILNALFPSWECVHATSVEGIDDVAQIIEFHGSQIENSMNRFCVDYCGLVNAWFQSFKSRCLGRIAYPPIRSRVRHAVYAKRNASRILHKDAEACLLSLFREFGYKIEEIDFGAFTIEDQITIARRAQVIFGVHGNNLANCIWLEKGAALIELFPVGFHSFDFQVFCEFAGAKYLGAEGRDRGFVHREGTRWPDWTLLHEKPYTTHTHHQDAVKFIPVDVISTFLAALD